MVKVRFIDSALMGLKPRRIRYDVHDPEITGLLLRVLPHGRKAWMVSYRASTGIVHRKQIGSYPTMRIAEARNAALSALNGSPGEAGPSSRSPLIPSTATGPAPGAFGGAGGRGRVIVVGSAKGGTGKSTTAMHLIVSLLYAGRSVGSLDLDSPQLTLSRYLENRQASNQESGLDLPCPEHVGSSDPEKKSGPFEGNLNRLTRACDFVVIDTPGSDSVVSRIAHSRADVVITPINDSFVDLDTLAVLDREAEEVVRHGHYAAMIGDARRRKIAETGGAFDWIVLRNRLSNLDARNKQQMADALDSLSDALGFRNCAGLSERVIYRELFLKGLTLLDLRDKGSGVDLSMSHLAARQELRALLQSLGLSETADSEQS